MKKVLMIASVWGFLGSFERNDIKLLQSQSYQVVCGANCSKDLGAFGDSGQLDDLKVEKHHIDFPRTPFSKEMLRAYRQLKKLMKENAFELIHCHTPTAGILTRLAARKTRKKGTTVIYTAHGFHFYKGAPLRNWLFYYPIEKICSYFTDVLITINQEDDALAKRKMKAKKIVCVPGVGIDTKKFAAICVNREKKRKELGISKEAIVLLSVGELNKNKNHEVIIRALAQLKEKKIHYFIAGQGELKNYLIKLAETLEIKEQVHLLGFRNDIGELYKITDIFCFPSQREGLSLSLMEAMAFKLPVVCSKIRGNTDLIVEDQGGYLCDPKDVDAFVRILKTVSESQKLRLAMGAFNADAVKRFDLKNVEKEMEAIYEGIEK